MLGNFFNPTTGLYALRMLLQFGGFWLTINGYATADDVANAQGAIEQIAGPLMLLIGLGANLFATFRTKIVVGGQSVGKADIAKTVSPGSATVVVQVAKAALERKPTLFESWFGRR